RLLGHEDRHAALLRQLLDPGRDVHGVADRRVLAPLGRPDVADDHGARMDADTHPERGRPAGRALRIQAAERRVHRAGAADGAPKYAMIPSPRYLSSVPPCAKSVSTMRAWYSFRIRTTSSLGSDSPSAVKSRRSLKRIVTSRLSPAGPCSSRVSSIADTCGEK